jgi:hypothetical protein
MAINKIKTYISLSYGYQMGKKFIFRLLMKMDELGVRRWWARVLFISILAFFGMVDSD